MEVIVALSIYSPARALSNQVKKNQIKSNC